LEKKIIVGTECHFVINPVTNSPYVSLMPLISVVFLSSAITLNISETRAVESESEGILGGVGVGKNVPTPTPTSA
jgi:hypothetical protein